MAVPRPLRVLLYRPPWRTGEVYFRAQQVAAHFQDAGHHVTIVAGRPGWRSVGRLLGWPYRLARADLVFLYPQPLMPFFALSALWLGRRVVIDHFTSYVRMADVSPRIGRVLAPFDRVAYRQADAVLAHTRSVADDLCAIHGLAPRRVHTIYSVVKTAHFAPVYDRDAAALRERFGLTGRFVVLYHGMWHPWHGVNVLRSAVAQLADAGESVSLVMIGHAGACAPHERLLDEVPFGDLPAHIQMADVWCSGFTNLPRGDRSLSSTLIQALAMARPVITSPSPEKSAVLRNEETAFFVPPDDPATLADSIRHCRRHPDFARRVGKAGRELAKRLFDIAAFDRLLADLTQTWFGT